jgi:hypothetical protein
MMMVVEQIGTGVHDGTDLFVWRGTTFTLTGSGAGPQGAFLGDMVATPYGIGEWPIPVTGSVMKAVPVEESDWNMP